MYILIPLIVMLVIGFLLVCGLASVFSTQESQKARAEELKEQREKAKLEVDRLRAARLLRDLMVVENRALLVGNQSIMVELRIEEKRKELGLDVAPFQPQ